MYLYYRYRRQCRRRVTLDLTRYTLQHGHTTGAGRGGGSMWGQGAHHRNGGQLINQTGDCACMCRPDTNTDYNEKQFSPEIARHSQLGWLLERRASEYSSWQDKYASVTHVTGSQPGSLAALDQ